MSLWESIRIALRGLRANKMRTGLTMLGVIIGVGAVIVMVGIGQGAARQIREQFSSMGTNLLSINRGNFRRMGPPGAGQSPVTSLVPADAEMIARRFPDTVALVAQVSRGSGQVKFGNSTVPSTIMGVTPEYETVAKRPVESGRFISAADENGRHRVAILGKTVIENLWGDRAADPLGQDLLLNRTRYSVVGILQEKGAGGFMDQDDIVIIPCSTAMRRVFNQTSLNEINVMCRTEDDMALATEQIASLLRERHKLRPPFPDNDDFTIRSQSQILEASAQSSRTMTSLLGGIALVSLLVGGIGIMNIMLVSVTERTREIGLRKAVGATRHDILLQFLIEAVVISVLGGVLGILLGWSLGELAGKLLSLQPVIQIHVVVLAVLVSAAIGIFFGLYPARRAAALNPIEALRYE